jgi:hypothetical protein
VEDVPAKDKTFRLSGRKAKKPKRVVFRQEKRHPIKAQILIERETKKF